MEKYYVGTEFRIFLNVQSNGFSLDEDPWFATITCGRKSVHYDAETRTTKEDDQWYLLVNTSEIGAGQYFLTVEIDIPDDAFDDGYRHEVLHQEKPILIMHNVKKV